MDTQSQMDSGNYASCTSEQGCNQTELDDPIASQALARGHSGKFTKKNPNPPSRSHGKPCSGRSKGSIGSCDTMLPLNLAHQAGILGNTFDAPATRSKAQQQPQVEAEVALVQLHHKYNYVKTSLAQNKSRRV